MDPKLEEKLSEAGSELRARHDDAVIADIIGEVEALEDENAQITGEILRKMVESE